MDAVGKGGGRENPWNNGSWRRWRVKDGQGEVRNPIQRCLNLEVQHDGEVGKMKTIPQSQQNPRAQEK